MAFEGLVQWSEGVVEQRKCLAFAISSTGQKGMTAKRRRAAIHASNRHAYYFAMAAWKLLEHRCWVTKLGLCRNVDFAEIDRFSKSDIQDLRDMREHQVDYFRGIGRVPQRWKKI